MDAPTWKGESFQAGDSVLTYAGGVDPMSNYILSSGFRPDLSRLNAAQLRCAYDAWIADQIGVAS